MYFFITFLTGLALSLDAFSLSIIYGTIIKEKKTILLISIIVGIFHFLMPLLGYFLSSLFIIKIISKINILSFLIFLILGLEMFFSKNNENDLINLNSIYSIIVFAFTVSIDSFSIGIALTNKDILIPIIIFSITSFFFTYLGLNIGKKLSKIKGINKVGGIILILLSIYYLFT